MDHGTARTKRTFRDYLGISARGFCMGVADVVPGVSGGTMAFILGVYEELLDAVHAVNARFLRSLVTFRFGDAFDGFPHRFLIALVTGIFVAIFSLAQFFAWALDHHPVHVWAFFFGLVLASIITVRGKVSRWTVKEALALLLAAAGAFVLVGAVPVETPSAAWFVFLSGAIAICAMILPGISGSFILVILGKYQYMLTAVVERNFVPILIFGCGGILGLVFFARALRWLLRRFHDVTVAALIGLMAGSLRKIWPWKEVEENVLPASLSGEVLLSIGLGIAGCAIVVIIERLASRRPAGDTVD
ncbi:MAG: DUF368 domain-containing protein [Gemmatimonadota bacterium]|nr:DUF368 domain-containing protein [Gemmatimonadota bacterium]